MDQQSSPLSNLTPAQRTQLMNQMKSEVEIASARELMEVCASFFFHIIVLAFIEQVFREMYYKARLLSR